MLLRELLERMGSDLVDQAADAAYMDSRESSRGLSDKEIPLEMPLDYDGIDALNPKTSIRDQEYLQHSTLWSNQQLNNNYKTNDRHRVKPSAAALAAAAAAAKAKDEKAENQLPAYCTPPNPCPVGYTSEYMSLGYLFLCEVQDISSCTAALFVIFLNIQIYVNLMKSY